MLLIIDQKGARNPAVMHVGFESIHVKAFGTYEGAETWPCGLVEKEKMSIDLCVQPEIGPSVMNDKRDVFFKALN